MNKKEIDRIKTMVYQHCGLLLDGIAEERLNKAVETYKKEWCCASLPAYRQLLSTNKQAFDQLINQLTVNETYFFREPEQIKLLVEQLIPQVLANKAPTAQIRILSAGCSSGEEPYSLAIALREALGEAAAKRVHIDAGDLDQEILKKAAAGLYSDFSFRGVKPEIRKRYFKAQTLGHQLIPEIRQLVEFHELNLLAPVFPKQLGNYDIVFFRNVSIYFDQKTRLLIHKKFYELMQTNGILILGSSETLGNNLGVFELVEQESQYYFVKGSAYLSNTQPIDKNLPDLELKLEPAPLPTQTFEPSIKTNPSVDLSLPDINSLQQLVIDGEQERALLLLDQLLASDEAHQPARLLKSWLLLNNQDYLLAEQLLKSAFTADPWSVDVMLMMGLSHKWQDQLEDAVGWFKKAVYTYPECWSAHYYLADIYRHQQEAEAALRSYQTVLRILNANPEVGDGTQWIPLPLPAVHVIFLSQRHLQQLSTDLYAVGR